ncbi:TPA: hypothetical protein ACNU7F_005142 [Escherichia coli]|uniref:hypothetical protein n=2 Tax=Escherichia coli TaxID=562 RepID=UPI0003BB1897|nr:hypothetical protein [Escherichia coli]APK29740.1 hypothetical protein RG40_10535 [Escherichia coli]AZW06461.1 hypothetical protein CRG85_21985 [Escherichia coli]EFB3491881.1 hypothetical protein [Escherichia coli]EFF0506878.1 hypothetical protein [Escherichia coli]EFH9199836.1 hypothetical protein [Escherichia coli]
MNRWDLLSLKNNIFICFCIVFVKEFGLKRKLICVMAFWGALLAGCNESNKKEVEGCIERGVQYFIEIGSYPKLSDGRDAVKVATERCNRTITAF